MEKHKEINYNEIISQLLSSLEKDNIAIKNSLLDSYLGKPVSIEMEEEIYKYFFTHSVVSTATMANPGTSLITEFLYEGPSSSFFPIDDYFLQSKGGSAIKERLLAVEKNLPKIIEGYRSRGKVLIGNFGSGPGRDIIDIFSDYYQADRSIRSIYIDRDIAALKRGKRMAKIKKVDHLIDFIEGNFLKQKPKEKFDIVLLIGVLCGLKSDTCIKVLKAVRRFIKKGGTIVASNVSNKMLEEDPFTYFLMEWVGNWRLVFKDEKELKRIFEKAGYKWKGSFTDSYGFHTMGIGTPRSYF